MFPKFKEGELGTQDVMIDWGRRWEKKWGMTRTSVVGVMQAKVPPIPTLEEQVRCSFQSQLRRGSRL